MKGKIIFLTCTADIPVSAKTRQIITKSQLLVIPHFSFNFIKKVGSGINVLVNIDNFN